MADESSSAPSSPSSPPPGPRAALRWYLAATALVGAGAGLFTGLSSSPVVGVLLPLLFGLLGGAGGLYVATLDLEDRKAQLKIRTFGTVVATLMIALLPFAVYGVMLRTGVGIASFLPRLRTGGPLAAPEIVVMPNADPTIGLELALLRRKLEILGASREEQRAILAAAQQRASGPFTKEALVATLRRVALTAKQTYAQFDRGAIEATKEQGQQRAAYEMFSLVGKMAAHYEFSADYLDRNPQVPLSSLQQRLGTDRDQLSALVHGYDGSTWLSQNDALQAALWKLEIALVDEADRTGSSWMSGSRFAAAFDAFLSASRGAGADAPRTSGPDPILRPSVAR